LSGEGFLKEVEQEVFTIPEAGKFCGVSRWTIRNLVTSGRLKASRTHGGHYRILKTDLETFLHENKLFSFQQSQPRKILIADDDAQIRSLLGRVARDSGYDVEYAFDGFETGKKVIKFRPDLIILDLIMPGMDGFEVCRRLKEDKDTADIMIIAISGYATKENRRRILDCGADLFLEKPLDIKKLQMEIDHLLA
jgi:excisionase family DNA binding protein